MANLIESSSSHGKYNLRGVDEVPEPYRNIFAAYPHFNIIQSAVFNDVFYKDESVVVSAPTGSGKTIIFELAVIRLLLNWETTTFKNYKIIYISPTKALCEERLVDWHKKFSEFGLSCISVTGDSPNLDFSNLTNNNLIITTPEKWDSLTRRWRDNEAFVRAIKLLMIDEIHLLSDETRGPTLEAIVTRMKTIRLSTHLGVKLSNSENSIRFIGVSATITNVVDIAEWFGTPGKPALYFKFDDEVRPVKLKKIIQGYPYNPSVSTPFKFDIMLSYKLHNVLLQHSSGKPSLIFCSTRKSVEMTTKQLVQNLTINLDPERKQILIDAANKLEDGKIKDVLVHGVGRHHAGMLLEDRRLIENLFREGNLPVLVTTSTLAMGVNLPAHLVVIKSTKYYADGQYKDYNESMLFQMIGRAGRPQFDNSAVAVIMTTVADKNKYENMISGEVPVESYLHKTLAEHVNAEVVLGTITDLSIAMHWLSSTFLYIRARKNPKQYSLPLGLTQNQLDKKLLEMCQIEINKLAKAGMLTIDQNVLILPTQTGTLMARYCVALETMKLFIQVSGKEVLQQILALISKCREFSEIRLRTNDKRPLNILNRNRDKKTIRFTLSGRIKTLDMKINCIVQAVLGSLEILESSLLVEGQKIMRIGERLLNCLSEYLQCNVNCYQALLSSVTLAKCFHARIWENSLYVSRQLDGIGLSLSNLLVNSGKTTFKDILNSNPRDLERILNKKPPAGNKIQDQVKMLPQYSLTVKEVILEDGKVTVQLVIVLENKEDLHTEITVNPNSTMILLVGDSENTVLLHEKYTHMYMIENVEVTKNIDVKTNFEHEVFVNFISENWVGIDVQKSIKLFAEEEKNVPKNIEATENVKVLPDSTEGNARLTVNIKKKEKSQKTRMLQQLMDRYFKKTKSVKLENRGFTRRRSSGQLKRKSSASKVNDSKMEKELTAFGEETVELERNISDEVSKQCEQHLKDEPGENNFGKEVLDTDVKKLSSSTQNMISNIAKKTVSISFGLLNSSIESADDVIPSTSTASSLMSFHAKSRKNIYKTNANLVKQRKRMFNEMKTLEFENFGYTPTDKSKIDVSRFAKAPKEKLNVNILKYDNPPKKIRLEDNNGKLKTLTWSSPLVVAPKLIDSQQLSKDVPTVTKTDDDSSITSPKIPSLRDNFENYSLSDKDCGYNQEGEYQKCTDVVSNSLLELLGLKTTKADVTFPNDCQLPSNWAHLEKDGLRSTKCDLNQTVSSASSGSTHTSKAQKIMIIDPATYCAQTLKQASENRVISKSKASQTEDQDFNKQDSKEDDQDFKNDEESTHEEPHMLKENDAIFFCQSPSHYEGSGMKKVFEGNDKSGGSKSTMHRKQSWEEAFLGSEPFLENIQSGGDQNCSSVSFEHINLNKLGNTRASTLGELSHSDWIVNKNNQQAVVSNNKCIDQSRNYPTFPNCTTTKEIPEEDQAIFRNACHDENKQVMLNKRKYIDQSSNYFPFSYHTIAKGIPEEDRAFMRNSRDDIFQRKCSKKIEQENRDNYCSNSRNDLVFQKEPRGWSDPTNFFNDGFNKPAYESNGQYQHYKFLNESFHNENPHSNYLGRERHSQELRNIRTRFNEVSYLPVMEASSSSNHQRYVQNYLCFGDMDKNFENGITGSNFSRNGRLHKRILEPSLKESNPAYFCHPHTLHTNNDLFPLKSSGNFSQAYQANHEVTNSGYDERFNHSNLVPNHSLMKDEVDEVGYFNDADKENRFDHFNKSCFEPVRNKRQATSSDDRFLLRQQEVESVACQDVNCKKCRYKSSFADVNRQSSSKFYEEKNFLFNPDPAYHDVQNNQQRNVCGLNEMNRNNFLLSRYFNFNPKKETTINRQLLNLNHTVTSESQMYNLNRKFDF